MRRAPLLTVVVVLGVLLGVVLPALLPDNAPQDVASAKPVTVTVVNAAEGVFWRSSPDWNAAIRDVGRGAYDGDQLILECYVRGGTVPPAYNNPLWYQARVVAGRGIGEGLINDHQLSTGSNQPNVVMAGVPSCGQSAPAAPPTFAARRCSGDASGHIVESLAAEPDQNGYKITIKPGDKGGVSWYADNDKIAAATSDMWNIVKPCLAGLPLKLSSAELKTAYYQLNCHFWGQRAQWLGFSFGGTYDLETWRPASAIPSGNVALQKFYASNRCNW